MLEVQQGDDENVHLNEALIKHGHEQATSQLQRENWQRVRRQRRRMQCCAVMSSKNVAIGTA